MTPNTAPGKGGWHARWRGSRQLEPRACIYRIVLR